MPQLHINHVRGQVEIEDHFNILISSFGTDASGSSEFSYAELLSLFLHLPTNLRSTARFGDDCGGCR